MKATTVTPMGCAVEGCGITRRLHDDSHRYQPPGMGTILARAEARKKCGHWDGTQQRECGSQVGVRAFIQGPRCPIHDPNVLKAVTA